MKNMKALLLALMVATTLVVPKKSEAAVSLFTGNGILALYGLGATVAGPVAFVGGVADVDSKFSLPLIWGGALSFVAGIIMLDGEQEQMMAFETLSPDKSNALGLTNIQSETFNAEIDQANIILEEVSFEVEQLDNRGYEDIRGLWNEYGEYLSPETFQAIEKISLQLM
ncbi:MAG: hypothetical protein CME62_12355 [Halobacteriovoraceae bacterium]|nr:hypothetical protein [Halobacteriovoraceae bacterium]